jgi:hypothetical protein
VFAVYRTCRLNRYRTMFYTKGNNMTRIVVRWCPPYSNSYKDQPCQFEREAVEMAKWFTSIGVRSSIIRVTEIETVIS